LYILLLIIEDREGRKKGREGSRERQREERIIECNFGERN
jgi:hypothetical protein